MDLRDAGEYRLKEVQRLCHLFHLSNVDLPADFVPLQTGGLLAGRIGYSVVIPASDWLRTPRRGGAASVTVIVQPTDGTAFSTVAEERFP